MPSQIYLVTAYPPHSSKRLTMPLPCFSMPQQGSSMLFHCHTVLNSALAILIRANPSHSIQRLSIPLPVLSSQCPSQAGPCYSIAFQLQSYLCLCCSNRRTSVLFLCKSSLFNALASSLFAFPLQHISRHFLSDSVRNSAYP